MKKFNGGKIMALDLSPEGRKKALLEDLFSRSNLPHKYWGEKIWTVDDLSYSPIGYWHNDENWSIRLGKKKQINQAKKLLDGTLFYNEKSVPQRILISGLKKKKHIDLAFKAISNSVHRAAISSKESMAGAVLNCQFLGGIKNLVPNIPIFILQLIPNAENKIFLDVRDLICHAGHPLNNNPVILLAEGMTPLKASAVLFIKFDYVFFY